MHAGLSFNFDSINRVFQLGEKAGLDMEDLAKGFNRSTGIIMANGMALLVKLGFAFLVKDSLLSKENAKKSQTFFDENFVIDDPNAKGGQRFYQGRFLIRTRRAKDDMNVWVRFCPEPEDMYLSTPFGKALNPKALVSTTTLSEREADSIAEDPNKVDLVIQFKDVESILGLIGRDQVDIVGLLLENLVQLKGNVGHLFKLGAIAKNIELELGLTKH